MRLNVYFNMHVHGGPHERGAVRVKRLADSLTASKHDPFHAYETTGYVLARFIAPLAYVEATERVADDRFAWRHVFTFWDYSPSIHILFVVWVKPVATCVTTDSCSCCLKEWHQLPPQLWTAQRPDGTVAARRGQVGCPW